MNRPWSKIRQTLEKDFLCDSLKGRVRYFSTLYHKAHDDGGRICVLVDDIEIINMPFTFEIKTCEIAKKYKNTYVDLEIMEMVYDEIETKLHETGEFGPWDFGNAVTEYFSNPIQQSLQSNDMLVRMLAIMDRRVGLRTLKKLKQTVDELPEWLQYFYNLRLESQGV